MLGDLAAPAATVLPALLAAQVAGTQPALVVVGGAMVQVPGRVPGAARSR